jgi:glyoxylase-like metal-dependent hydrolase (beta-lactamase superfamily II)
MANGSRRVGRFEVTAIVDAEMPDEPMTDAFPGLAPDALEAAEATYPDIYTEDGRWRLRVRAWLIIGDAGPILVDTGIGGASSPAREWTTETGHLFDMLAELGIRGTEIGTVIVSHVHDDHAGGIVTDDGDLAAPNAQHLVQRADVEWLRAATSTDEPGATAWRMLSTIEDAGILHVVEGDRSVSPGLSLRHLPGHTPGHQVVIIEDAGDRMILTADTWNHPLQISDPDGQSGSDDDPAAAAVARRTLFDDVEAHPGTIVAPTHFAEAFGTFRRIDDTWLWSPA